MNRKAAVEQNGLAHVPRICGDEPLDVPGRDQFARAYRALPSVADDARRYVQAAPAGRSPSLSHPGLLTADDAAKALTSGLEVGGFDCALNANTVRHLMGEHGDLAAEAARGQRAVTGADYGRLPRLLNAPDLVEDGGASGIGRPVVRYTKEMDGKTYTAAFEVRRGRRMLALQSIWIKAGAPSR